MKSKVKLLYNKLFRDKFSILAELGDLSKYSFEQMCLHLSYWEMKVLQNDHYFDATWQNKSNLITIRYELQSTKFIQIIDEEWKHFNLKFTRHQIVN
jgi:hypothetical protein